MRCHRAPRRSPAGVCTPRLHPTLLAPHRRLPLPALALCQLIKLDKSDIEAQIVGGRHEIAACGIPEGDIVGFRAPYLDTNPDVREVLHEAGFLYDRWAAACAFLGESGRGGVCWVLHRRLPSVRPRRARPCARPPPRACSSLMEDTQGDSVSQGKGGRIWPWDMASGVEVDCDW